MPMRRSALLNSKLVGKGTLAVLIGIAVLLGSLGPRVAALPVAVAHAQANPPAPQTADAVDVAAWSRQIEDYMSHVYVLIGEIVAVEMGPDGDPTAWIVVVRGSTKTLTTQYLYVGLNQTLAEQIQVGDIVQFAGRIVGSVTYESRMVPAVNLVPYFDQLVCEGDPLTCTDLPTPIPNPTPPSTTASTDFVVQRTALVLAGPDWEYRMVGSYRRGDVVAPIACTEDCQWLQLAEGQWIFAEAVDGPTESLPLVSGVGSPDPQVSTVPTPPSRPAGELTPDDEARSFYETGIAKAAGGQHAEALADFEDALRLSPQNAVYLYYRGAMKARLGREDEAQVDFEDALRLLPNLSWLLALQGTAKADLGHYAEAIAHFDGALHFDPHDGKTWNDRGVTKAHLGRYAEAIADYDTALKLIPHHFLPWGNRGIAKARLGRYAEAISDFDAALKLDPKNAVIWQERASAKHNLGRYAEAISDFDAALKFDPNNVDTWGGRGRTKFALGRYADAIADYDAALQLDPHDPLYLANRGLVKSTLGRYAEAIADFDVALSLDPEDAELWNDRGFAKHHLGHYAEALIDYNAAVQLDPHDPLYLVNRGLAKSDLGYHAEAIADFDAALQARPSSHPGLEIPRYRQGPPRPRGRGAGRLQCRAASGPPQCRDPV